MRERWRTGLWALGVVAVAMVFFHESLFRGRSLVSTDVFHQVVLPYCASVERIAVQNHYAIEIPYIDYAWAVFWQQTVRGGELPLWNPRILGGNPFLAESMTGALSPLRLPLLVLSAERAFTLTIVLEFVLTGLFMFALLRELGRSLPASFIGAVAWMLNSAFLMWYWRGLNVICWVPLVLLLLERSVRRDNWNHAVAAGVVLGVAFLCGSIQAAAHLGFLCVAYAVGVVWCVAPSARSRAGKQVAVVLLMGVLLSAVQWLPTLELMARDAYHSTQMRGTHASLRHTLLGLPSLITLVFPALTGSTETWDLMKFSTATRADFAGYIGIVPFALFMVGAFVSREKRVRAAIWIVAAVVTLLFFTPLVKYLYHRFLVVAVFAMTLIAAQGADLAMDADAVAGRIRRVWWWMILFGGAVIAVVVVAQVIILGFGERLSAIALKKVLASAQNYGHPDRPEFVRWYQERVMAFFQHYSLTNMEFWLPLGALFCSAAAWFSFQCRRVSQVTMGGVLVILTVVELLVLGRRLVPQCDLSRYPVAPATRLLEPLKNDKELFRVYRWGKDSGFILRQNWLMSFAVDDLCGTFSLAPESVESLPIVTNDQFNVLLDLVNVKYVFTTTEVRLPEQRFELVMEVDKVRLYRNPRCLPRLQFFGQWEVVTDRRQMLDRMTADTFDPSKTIFLETAPPGEPLSMRSPALITVKQYSACRVMAEVTTSQSGILLLADTWYPGWLARVDGVPVQLYRADHVLRAVFVPAGRHVVEFEFRPPLFRLGLAIGLVTLVGAGVLGAIYTVKRQRSICDRKTGCDA